MVRTVTKSLIGVAVVLGLVVPSASWAQAAKGKKAPPAGAVEIEEITVTAQKREESIQEIPVSVTAISSEALRARGVTDVLAIGEVAPNVRISTNPATQSGTTISIRGAGQGNPNPVFQPAAALYVDGVYIAGIQGSNLDLEDLERVEVLRGPQGTLFGRNTVAGLANFITKKPTEVRSITLQTDAGNFDAFKGRVTLNVPLIGKNGFFQSEALGTLSLRQNAAYKHHDAFYENKSPTTTPSSGSAGLDSLNRIFTMTALRWNPTKDITIDYSYEYHRYLNAGSAFQVSYIYPGSPVSAGPLSLVPYLQKNRSDSTGNNSVCDPSRNCDNRLKDHGNHRMNILTGAWDLGEVGPLGKVTLKSIASYRSFVHAHNADLDGSPLHLAETHAILKTQHWSEELQWVGTAPRINYLVGGYYYGEYSHLHQDQYFFAGANILPYAATVTTKSYAPFGQFTFTPPFLWDKLSVTGGIRYTQEQVHTDRTFNCVAIISGGRNICNVTPNPALNNWSASRGRAFGGTDGLSPMGNITYQWTDDFMTYFRVARGFKGGGFNGSTTDPQVFATNVFDPEKLLQYELGFKSQWFGNRLRLNANGFYSDYSDMQVSVFRPTATAGLASIVSNAASAEILGSEVELAAVPLRGLDVTAAYSFLDPKFEEWLDQKVDANNRAVFGPDGQPVLEDVKDQRDFPYAPRHQFSIGVGYTAPPTTAGVLSARVDVYWQDKVTFIANNNTAGAQAFEAANYALVNGRIQFADIPLQRGSLDIAVFGRNLFDKKYRSHGIDFGRGFGFSGNNYGPPRTFGLQLTYNFEAAAAEALPPPAPVAQAAPPPPAKKKIVLRSVHFDFDKATLKADAKPILDEAVQVLQQEGSVDIVVEGHTDSVGTDQYNLGLSRRRAETVRRYLVEHGVAPSRITAEGLGESKPVASNDTADGRAQNRRVELHVK